MAFRHPVGLYGPGRKGSQRSRKPEWAGTNVVGGKAETMVWRTEVLSAAAATISDRDRSAFRPSGDRFRPGQKCFPLKRRPFRTETEVLSAQAATVSDRDGSAFRLSGDHFGP